MLDKKKIISAQIRLQIKLMSQMTGKVMSLSIHNWCFLAMCQFAFRVLQATFPIGWSTVSETHMLGGN